MACSNACGNRKPTARWVTYCRALLRLWNYASEIFCPKHKSTNTRGKGTTSVMRFISVRLGSNALEHALMGGCHL